MSLLELFCHVDDFCHNFQAQWEPVLLAHSVKHRHRARRLSLSEVMTILIHFHQSHYRDFKAFYTRYVQKHLHTEFPGLVSYTRFIEFIPSTVVPLCVYLRHCQKICTGISFIDSTDLTVCHNRRIAQHQVFADLAKRGHTSTGWFFGFKVHFVFNDQGELLACTLTPGNVDDRKPVPQLAQRLFGKLFGDKGYLSHKLREELRRTFNVELITKLRRNMKNQLMPLADRLLLRKRAIVETIIDQLKNISQIEHTRHRSLTSFLANLLCGLIAYCHQPKKPSLLAKDMLALPA